MIHELYVNKGNKNKKIMKLSPLFSVKDFHSCVYLFFFWWWRILQLLDVKSNELPVLSKTLTHAATVASGSLLLSHLWFWSQTDKNLTENQSFFNVWKIRMQRPLCLNWANQTEISLNANCFQTARIGQVSMMVAWSLSMIILDSGSVHWAHCLLSFGDFISANTLLLFPLICMFMV